MTFAAFGYTVLHEDLIQRFTAFFFRWDDGALSELVRCWAGLITVRLFLTGTVLPAASVSDDVTSVPTEEGMDVDAGFEVLILDSAAADRPLTSTSGLADLNVDLSDSSMDPSLLDPGQYSGFVVIVWLKFNPLPQIISSRPSASFMAPSIEQGISEGDAAVNLGL